MAIYKRWDLNVDLRRIELLISACKADVFPLALQALSGKLVPHERIELPSEDYKAPVLPLY